MTKVAYTENMQNTTTAQFRLWGKNLSDALTAVGLVQTADTGQIDWTSVTLPAMGSMGGYEVYAFPGAMQATRPYFLKIKYGSGDSYANVPRITIQLCLGMNGSGTLVGDSSYRAEWWSSWSDGNGVMLPGNAARTFVSLTADDQLTLSWGSRSCNYQTGLMSCLFARTVDDAGAVVSDGMYYGYQTTGTWTFYQDCHIPETPAIAYPCVPGALVLPVNFPTTSRGLEVQVFRHFFNAVRPLNIPACVSYMDAEIPPLSEFNVSVIPGVSRKYLALGAGAWPFSLSKGGCSTDLQARAALAILWED